MWQGDQIERLDVMSVVPPENFADPMEWMDVRDYLRTLRLAVSQVVFPPDHPGFTIDQLRQAAREVWGELKP